MHLGMLPYAVVVLAVLSSQQVTAARTAYVSSDTPGTILDALQDQQVHTIVLLTNYTLYDQLVALASPLPINRNITFTGNPGQLPVVDFGFQRAKLLLCSKCVFTFKGIVIANIRHGIGPEFDALIGQDGSMVQAIDCIRLRLACTDAQSILAGAQAAPRSPLLPNSTLPQTVALVDAYYQGEVFPSSYMSIDFTTDIPVGTIQGRRSGGYAVAEYNDTRICEHTVTPACLTIKTAEDCVNELINSILAAETGHGTAAGGRRLSHTELAAAIAVPVAVVGTGLVTTAALLWAHERHKHKTQQPQADKGSDHKGLPGPIAGMDVEQGPAKLRLAALQTKQSHNQGLPSEKQGWELVGSGTAPYLGKVKHKEIKFGEFLVSARFGRVHAATWAGRQVAVKILEHETSTLRAVEHEVQLILSFDHPNLVRTFYYMMYAYSEGAGPAAAVVSGPAAIAGAVHVSNGRGAYSRQSSHCGTSSTNGSGYVTLTPELFATGSAKPPSSPHPTATAITAGTNAMDHHNDPAQNVHGHHAQNDAQDLQQDQQSEQHQHGRQQQQQHYLPVDSQIPVETWLVREFCDHGTLCSFARSRYGLQQQPSSSDDMLRLLLLLHDVAAGLKALHTSSVIHGDLNSQSVLVSSCPGAKYEVVAKLADFGLARIIKQYNTRSSAQSGAMMTYMPPELLRYGRISPAADIYAVGIMMYEVYTGQSAFPDLHYGQFFDAIVLRHQRPQPPASMPPDYVQLMRQCWAADQTERPSVDQLLQALNAMIVQRQMQSQGQHKTASSGNV